MFGGAPIIVLYNNGNITCFKQQCQFKQQCANHVSILGESTLGYARLKTGFSPQLTIDNDRIVSCTTENENPLYDEADNIHPYNIDELGRGVVHRKDVKDIGLEKIIKNLSLEDKEKFRRILASDCYLD